MVKIESSTRPGGSSIPSPLPLQRNPCSTGRFSSATIPARRKWWRISGCPTNPGRDATSMTPQPGFLQTMATAESERCDHGFGMGKAGVCLSPHGLSLCFSLSKRSLGSGGVPQRRKRFFILAAKDVNLKIETPSETHEQEVSVRDAFIDIPEVVANTNEENPVYLDRNSEYSLLMKNDQFWKRKTVEKKLLNHLPMNHRKYIIERFSILRQGEGLKE